VLALARRQLAVEILHHEIHELATGHARSPVTSSRPASSFWAAADVHPHLRRSLRSASEYSVQWRLSRRTASSGTRGESSEAAIVATFRSTIVDTTL
jgi:hypothetical protein